METSLLKGVKPRPVSQDFQSFSLYSKAKVKHDYTNSKKELSILQLSNIDYYLNVRLKTSSHICCNRVLLLLLKISEND